MTNAPHRSPKVGNRATTARAIGVPPRLEVTFRSPYAMRNLAKELLIAADKLEESPDPEDYRLFVFHDWWIEGAEL